VRKRKEGKGYSTYSDLLERGEASMNAIREGKIKKTEIVGLVAALVIPLLIYGIVRLDEIYFVWSSPTLHFAIEILSFAVGLAIFGFAIQGFKVAGSRRILLLGSAFLLMGLLDAIHAFAFKDMPALIIPTGSAYATYYWILSKVFGAVLLFLSVLLPDVTIGEKSRKKVSLVVSVSIVVFSLFVGWFIANYIEFLPPMFVAGQGLTPLKIYLEYFVMFLLAATCVLYLRIFLKTGNRLLYFFIVGFVFFITSEMSFTLYRDVWDVNIWLGHSFKVISYGFFLIGLIDLYLSKSD